MSKLNWAKQTCFVVLLCTTTAISLPAQTFTTLYNFCTQTNCTDGDRPLAGPVQATDGNFYGTTYQGGANNGGTVYKITSSGALTTLYSFCSQSACTDGELPLAGLVQATDGNFYGTTSQGGAKTYKSAVEGTVFKITASGALTTLYSFCSLSDCTDGSVPSAGLVQATDGNFYGTTQLGGAYESSCNVFGCGTVFKITPAGTLTKLYSFCSLYNPGCADGQEPVAGLIQATDGNFYGTTSRGGASSACGSYGCGTVFKITPSGTLTTLYSFCARSGCTDGETPEGTLVQATDGNFYGATGGGGTNGDGTVFKITPGGTLTTLHSFDGTDGSGPGSLVQDTNGSFYGTTVNGGASNACNYGCGTVFSLSVGLGPFVETEPTSGKVGSVIKILGTDLAGATSVTFNGTPAAFKVLSTLIGATVPAGATTGTVEVTTPHGTLNSNVPFRVQP